MTTTASLTHGKNKSTPSLIKNPSFWRGLILAAFIALLSLFLADTTLIKQYGLSALTIAIVIGIFIGNTIFPAISSSTISGVDFSKSRLLRIGIVLYGFRITFQQITDVGWSGMAIDIVMLTSTFFLAIWAGVQVFRLDRETSTLIGAGSAICGAAAVLATEHVIRAQAHKVSVAVATVVIFGTISMFLYPVLFPYLGISEHSYGVYVGSTVHEVAQVVAAGRAINEPTAETAVIVKMLRVMMLAPFLMILSTLYKKSPENSQHSNTKKLNSSFPWFAVFFILISIFNSFELLPQNVINVIITLDTLIMAMAMAALGLRTHFSAFKQAGLRPIMLAATLFLYLVVGGHIVNGVISNILG